MFLDWQKYVMQKENVQITQNIILRRMLTLALDVQMAHFWRLIRGSGR